MGDAGAISRQAEAWALHCGCAGQSKHRGCIILRASGARIRSHSRCGSGRQWTDHESMQERKIALSHGLNLAFEIALRQ